MSTRHNLINFQQSQLLNFQKLPAGQWSREEQDNNITQPEHMLRKSQLALVTPNKEQVPLVIE